jgi:adenosine kinase
MKQYVNECRELAIPYIYDPSQQIVRLTGEELRTGIEGAMALFVNDYESGLVQKVTKMQPHDILEHIQFMVVTCGSHGSKVYTRESVVQIPIIPPSHMADPTGVGDAYRGGFLAGYCHQLDLLTCAQMGSLAATYCVEKEGTQGHTYTPMEFIARYRKHFDDQGKLDRLLTK